MNDDENLVTEYRSWKEEERLINEAIINEVREKSIEETKKEMVLNMHKDKLDLDLICKYANLTEDEVRKIIDNKVN